MKKTINLRDKCVGGSITRDIILAHISIIKTLLIIATVLFVCPFGVADVIDSDIQYISISPDQNPFSEDFDIDELILVILSYPDQALPYYVELESSLSREIMRDADPSARMVEFISLNTLRDQPDQLKLLSDLISAEYEDVPLNAIIAIDAPALEFITEIRDNIFPKTPIIYYETNNNFPVDLPVNSYYFPFVDTAEETLELALLLHPDTARLVIIAGQSEPYLQSIRDITNKAYEISPHIIVESLITPLYDETDAYVSTLPKNTVILYLGYGTDLYGNTYTSRDRFSSIASATSVPIYSPRSDLEGNGIVGGYIQNPTHMGEIIGDFVLHLLDARTSGEAVLSPELMARFNPFTQYRFDWNKLQQHSINEKLLPTNSVLINQPDDSWKQYIIVLVGAAALILFLLGLVAMMLIGKRDLTASKLELEEAYSSLQKKSELLFAQNAELTATESELHNQYTALLESRKSFQKSEAKYRSIIENLQDFFFQTDAHDIITLASPSFVQALGYPQNEVVGKLITTFISRFDEAVSFMDELKTSGSVSQFPLYLRRKNGSEIFVQASAHVSSENDVVVGIECIMRDVTAEQAIHAEVQRQNTILFSLKETVHSGILIVNEHRKIQSWNENFLNIFGISLDKLEGEKNDAEVFQSVMHCFYDPELAKDIVEGIYAATNERYSDEVLLTNGMIIERYTTPIFDSTNSYVGRLWEFIDITNRVERDKKLQDAYINIEAQNEELHATEIELRKQFSKISEQKDALQKSEEKYRRVLDDLLDIYYMVDSEFIIQLASQSVATTLGYDSLDDIIGHSLSEFLPENWEDVSSIFEETKYDVIKSFPMRLRTRDGVVLECLVSGKPIYVDGVFVGREGIIKDITDLKYIETELLRQNSVLLAVQENLAGGLFISDEKHKAMIWNQKFLEQWDFTSEELERNRNWEFVMTCLSLLRDSEEMKKWVNDVATDMDRVDSIEMVTLDNRILDVHSTPIYGPDNAYYGRLWEFVDITDRVQRERDLISAKDELQQQYDIILEGEQKLKESEEQYRSIINAMQDMYYRADKDGLFSMVNPSMVSTLGYESEADFIGKLAESFITDNYRSGFIAKIYKDGFVSNYPCALFRADGTGLFCHISSHIIYDDNGNAIGREGIARDMSVEKAAQDELARQNRILSAFKETTNDGMFIVDEHYNVLAWNQKFADLFDIPQSMLEAGNEKEIFARTLEMFSEPDQNSTRIKEIYEKQLEDVRDEVMLIDGSIIDRYTTPILSSDGHYFGRLWEFVDITDRVQREQKLYEAYSNIEAQNEELQATEEELRRQFYLLQDQEVALKKSEEKYRRILEELLDIYYMVDENFVIQLVSNSVVTALGYDSLDDFIGHPMSEFVPDCWQTIVSSDDAKKYEFITSHPMQLRRRDGIVLDCLVSGKPIYVDGVFAGREGIIKDITSFKCIQDNLTRQNSVLLAVKEVLVGGLLITDENQMSFLWNQTFLDQWGFTNSELQQNRSLDLIARSFSQYRDQNAAYKWANEIILDKTQFVSDEIVRTDDTIFERHSAPIIGPDGTFYGRLWEFIDITDRVRREEELQDAYTSIEAQNEELQAAQDELRYQYSALKKVQDELTRQNSVLLAVQENLAGGLLITDENRDTLIWNQKFLDLWQFSGYELEKDRNWDFILRCFPLHNNANMQYDIVNEVEQDRTYYLHDEVTRTDGSIVERYSAPIVGPDGTYYGRLWEFIDITERVQREQELLATKEELQRQYDTIVEGERRLQESEYKYRSIINSMQDMYYRVDENYVITLVSPSLVATLGYSHESELLGKPEHILISDDVEYKTLIEAIEKDKLVSNYPCTFARTDDTGLYCLLAGHLLYDDEGEIIGHEGIARDMSKEKEQEDILHLKNSLLTALQEAYIHGIIVVDDNMIVLMFNRQFAEMWNMPKEMIYVGADGYEVFRYCMTQVYNPEILMSIAHEITNSRDMHWNSDMSLLNEETFHCYTSPIIGKDGTYYGRIWELRDITDSISQQMELEKAYTELLQKENQLTLALEGVGEGLWTWDTRTNVLSLNAEFAYRYRSLQETQSIDSFISAIHSDEQEHCLQIFDNFMENYSDARIDFEFQIQSAEGTWCWIIARGSVFDMDDDGVPTVVTGTFVDITERKQYEKSMHEASRKMLILSQITRHDILNQLSILFAMNDSLMDAISDPSIDPLLSIMDQALSTVQHQIEFTRDYQEIGINGAGWQNVNASIADAKAQLIRPPVELISDTIPLIFADPLLEKAVYNLIENSLRHGEHVTEIRITFSVAADNIGILTFKDNGIGVDPAIKERIFESGFGKNTGFGLFLVHEILEITGMTIHECGEFGKGAQFRITIPSGSWKWQ